MEERTKKAATAVARALLEDSELSFSAACVAAEIASGTLKRYVKHDTPETFLKKWGGSLATPERVKLVLQGTLRRLHEIARRAAKAKEREEARAAAKEILVPLPKPQRALGSHECQWVVNPKGPDYYCTAAVMGLYCVKHDLIAQQQAERRFKILRTA